MTSLTPRQTWRPINGLPSRQILEIDGDQIKWAADASHSGTCSIAEFQAWITASGAQLLQVE